MTHQIRHKRISKKGHPFLAGKRVDKRWFIAKNMAHQEGPKWHTKNSSDKDLTYYQLIEWKRYSNVPFQDADNDGVANIFDKAPLNPKNRKIVPPGLKLGNTKLTKEIGIFNLPRLKTCPGATPLCKRYCYAEQPEKFRSGVVYARNRNYAWTKLRTKQDRNWIATRRVEFSRVMSEMINNYGLRWFRIHESGDFYNQEYFNKWVAIAKACPNTSFLAYTKVWWLDTSEAPNNFTIRYSCDLSSTHIREDLPMCYVGVKKPTSFYLCRKRCEPGFCMACWDQKTDVHIPIHSISKANVDQMFFKQFNPEVPLELERRKHYIPDVKTITKLRKYEVKHNLMTPIIHEEPSREHIKKIR